jgi:hypothetical protein
MIAVFSTHHNRKWTLIFLGICGLAAGASITVGIDDNPPGVLLAFLSATAFVLAFAHPWRTARKFLILFVAAVLGFVLFIVLNIISDSIVQNPSTSAAVRNLIQGPLNDALSLIFIMVCSAAFLVGATGSITMFIRSLRRA